MPFKDKEKHKEYMKKYYQEHKQKNYQTEKCIKKRIKAQWKRRGLNIDKFDEIYKIYCETTNCDICDRILTSGNPTTSTTKCLDHNHKTGEFRCILCNSCNVFVK